MNIYWLVFQDLIEHAKYGGTHEFVYEFLNDVVEVETRKGNLPEDPGDLLSKIRNAKIINEIIRN